MLAPTAFDAAERRLQLTEVTRCLVQEWRRSSHLSLNVAYPGQVASTPALASGSSGLLCTLLQSSADPLRFDADAQSLADKLLQLPEARQVTRRMYCWVTSPPLSNLARPTKRERTSLGLRSIQMRRTAVGFCVAVPAAG